MGMSTTTGAASPDLPPFGRVVDELAPELLRVTIAICGPLDGEDALQDALLSALRAYPDLDPGADVRRWLLRIAHNRSIDVVRARRRRPVPSDELDAPVAPPHEPEPDLWRAVAALPTKQRAAVALRFVADLPHKEIGDLMDTSEDAARRNVHEGLTALRRRYVP